MSTTSDRSSAVEGRLKPSFLLLVYVNAFITGAVVMGFEMLGSRYLNPFFGSGIYTWAALISTVLAALTAGYFFGGWMADRKPTPAGLGWLIVGGSAYLGVIPLFADGMLDGLATLLGGLSDQHEFERWGSIAGAMLLLFVPLALLGVYSPYAIRLTLRATARSGTVAGRVYGISTLGSIFGTLFVTFYLIPTMGSRHITYLLAAIGLAAGLSFVLHAWRSARVKARGAIAGALLLAVAAGLAQPPAFAEAPDGRAIPAQASPAAKEAAERFLAYLRKQGVEIREATIEAGPGADGFRIVNFVFMGDSKTEVRVASFDAGSFVERANGEAVLTEVAFTDLESRERERTVVKIARFAADDLRWTARTRDTRVFVKALAVRDVVITPPSGETVRVASIDAALLRLDGSAGGAVEGLAVRTITSTGTKENGSLAAFDVESIVVDVPARLSIKGVSLRDLVANTPDQGNVRVAAIELRRLESVKLLDRNPADLHVFEFAIKGLEAPLSGAKDPNFERDMRELGYTMLKLSAEIAYRYDEATKTFDLGKLEIDIADAASFMLALRLSGLSPEDIKKALEPRPPGQPPGERPPREGADALALLARLNLVSAEMALRDKSLLGRLIKREAQRKQIDEAAIRAQYRLIVQTVRDEQTDPLAREGLDAVIAFIDDPGELQIKIRPPGPLSVMALAAMFAANPSQFRSVLGITITAKKP